MSATFKLKRGAESDLVSKNPKLAKGEPIVVFCNDGSVRLKIGNGVNYFNGLPYSTQIPDDSSITLQSNALALKGFDTAQFMTVPVKVADQALEWMPFNSFTGILEDVSYDPSNNSLVFIWNTTEGQKIDTVQLQEMFSPYTAGTGINISDNDIAVKIADDTEDFLSVNTNGLKVTGIQSAIDTVEANLQSQLDLVLVEQSNQLSELTNLRNDIDTLKQSYPEDLNTRLDSLQDSLDATISDVSELKNINFNNFITSDEVDQKINDTLAGVQVSIDRIDGGRITDVTNS